MLPGGLLKAGLGQDIVESGFAVLDNAAFIWAVAPIRLTGEQHAPYGYVILLRRLDDAFNAATAAATGARLSFLVAHEARRLAGWPVDPADLRVTMTMGDRATASFALAAMPGGERLIAMLTVPRPLLATVRRASLYTLLTNLLIGMAIALVVVMVLQRRVLGPLEALARQLSSIGNSHDDDLRVATTTPSPEIRAVALAVNTMLETIASKRNAETARDAAIEANRLKSEFLAVMSHEIRTPMNGVLGMIELVLRSELHAQQHQRLQIAQKSATSLLELLNSILDLSRLEAGRMGLEQGAFDVGDMIERVCELFQPRALEKGLVLSFARPPELAGALVTDGGKLRQIVSNLIGNAVKFTERGAVAVDIFCQAAGHSRQVLRIEVRDSGIGISPERLEAVFEPFRQEHDGIARRFGGSGLGLSIVKRLADLLGYRLTLTSELGVGSCFTLEATLDIAANVSHHDVSGIEAIGDLGLHVLVAEDNEVNQLVICAVLDNLGCSYELAADGKIALAACEDREQPFDAILMDVNMPLMDGLEVTRLLRQRERQRAPLPSEPAWIVGLTANAMVGDRQKCLEAGMNDYVSKPFYEDDIRAALTRGLVRRYAARDSSVRDDERQWASPRHIPGS